MNKQQKHFTELHDKLKKILDTYWEQVDVRGTCDDSVLDDLHSFFEENGYDLVDALSYVGKSYKE